MRDKTSRLASSVVEPERPGGRGLLIRHQPLAEPAIRNKTKEKHARREEKTGLAVATV